MRLRLLAVGRLKDGPERALVQRYVERAVPLARRFGLSGPEIVEVAESRARRADERRAEEARALGAHLAEAALIVLDERGAPVTSEAFARLVEARRAASSPALAIVIGGPDGLDETLRARAGIAIAYGAATFPHGLVRVLLAEQVYRALTILDGHPYHRGG